MSEYAEMSAASAKPARDVVYTLPARSSLFDERDRMDEHVELAEIRRDARGECRERLVRRHVARIRAAAEFGGELFDFAAHAFALIGQRDGRAVRVELTRDAGRDAPVVRDARHERDLAARSGVATESIARV